MSDLEEVLTQLAAKTGQAQLVWQAAMRADKDNEIDDDYEFEPIWLSLEHGRDNVWVCGYRVQIDEVTQWAVHLLGRSPFEAAGLMLALIEAQPPVEQ